MPIFIEISDKELELMNEYAEHNDITVSEAMRKVIFERIEDQFDIFLYEKAFGEYEKSAKIYTLTEAKAMLGIE